MKNLIRATTLFLLTTLSVASYAQTIEAAISSEAASNIKFLNLESEKYYINDSEYLDSNHFRYALTGHNKILKDVDSDGVKDFVTLLYYCEKVNCHLTTRSADLVVFKGLGKNQFTKLASVSLASFGVLAKINSVNNGIISITSSGYGENDPSCCPTDETTTFYKIKNKKLVRINS